MESEKNNQGEAASQKKQRKPRRKSPKFKLPKSAPEPVKALWDSATEEEKQKAHQAAVAILENWMGQSTQKEVAEKLGVPPLRVWQMSRQALVGLVAGLLKQPKARRSQQQPALPPEEDPNLLRKKIASLEKDLYMMKDLVGLLKEFPAHREAKSVADGEGKSGKKKKPADSSGTSEKDGPVAGGSGPKLFPPGSGPTTGGK